MLFFYQGEWSMAPLLAGKRIVVGVTGSIAAFKVVGWVSNLTKSEADVSVIMTSAAQQFIAPYSFAALTGTQPHGAMFDQGSHSPMAHIELAQEADVFLVAPATAQTIGRLAHGFADDLLSAAILATRAPVIICPAMNSQMYQHPATQRNLKMLKELDYIIVDPETGLMACKDEGPGRLVEWESIEAVLCRCISQQDLAGKKVLITAGPTREGLDPARFISNRSSGKMGYALAQEAYRRGGKVVLISGPSVLSCPPGVHRVAITTAQEMLEAVLEESDTADVIVKSAAVSDFRPQEIHAEKVKKEGAATCIELVQNPDILYTLGTRKREGQCLVGFAAESSNFIAEGKRKLERKNADLIVVNDIGKADTGFEADTNRVVLVSKDETIELPFCTKLETAGLIWDHICTRLIPAS